MNNNKLRSCLKRTAKKKKVEFSKFNRIYIIPNRDQLKLLENDPLTFDKKIVINQEQKRKFEVINQEHKGRFVVSIIEDNFEKT